MNGANLFDSNYKLVNKKLNFDPINITNFEDSNKKDYKDYALQSNPHNNIPNLNNHSVHLNNLYSGFTPYLQLNENYNNNVGISGIGVGGVIGVQSTRQSSSSKGDHHLIHLSNHHLNHLNNNLHLNSNYKINDVKSIINTEKKHRMLLMEEYKKTKTVFCKCKRSKCQKNYCECYAKKEKCAGCVCEDCENNPTECEHSTHSKLSTKKTGITTVMNKVNLNQMFNTLEKGTVREREYLSATQTNTKRNLLKELNEVGRNERCDRERGGGERLKNDESSGTGGISPGVGMIGTISGHGTLPGTFVGSTITNQNIIAEGCNCTKSNCRKKYCECFKAGFPCHDRCRCVECFNDFNAIRKPDRKLHSELTNYSKYEIEQISIQINGPFITVSKQKFIPSNPHVFIDNEMNIIVSKVLLKAFDINIDLYMRFLKSFSITPNENLNAQIDRQTDILEKYDHKDFSFTSEKHSGIVGNNIDQSERKKSPQFTRKKRFPS